MDIKKISENGIFEFKDFGNIWMYVCIYKNVVNYKYECKIIVYKNYKYKGYKKMKVIEEKIIDFSIVNIEDYVNKFYNEKRYNKIFNEYFEKLVNEKKIRVC